MVCNGVETEPVLQGITGEELTREASTAVNARLDILARGFWERQRPAFFDVGVCHPNADSHRDLDPDKIFRQLETEKKSQYASRVCRASYIYAITLQHGGWDGGDVFDTIVDLPS